MIKTILLILLFAVNGWTALNEKYSYKNFAEKKLTGRPASEFNNSEIRGSCFYHQYNVGDANVAKNVFPALMTGVTFYHCNLDNVKIPAGNFVDSSCTHKKIKVQNDREDWILDNKTENPKEPMTIQQRFRAGISTSPASIPMTKMTDWERSYFEKFYQEPDALRHLRRRYVYIYKADDVEYKMKAGNIGRISRFCYDNIPTQIAKDKFLVLVVAGLLFEDCMTLLSSDVDEFGKVLAPRKYKVTFLKDENLDELQCQEVPLEEFFDHIEQWGIIELP